MTVDPQLIVQLLVTVMTGAGIYAGLRAQLAALSERVTALRETVTHQGEQIDRLRDRRATDV